MTTPVSLAFISAEKSNIVQRLVAEAKPWFTALSPERAPATLQGLRLANPETGFGPVVLAGTRLPPVHGICEAGVIFNGYGNLAVCPWEQASIEDVLRLESVAQARVQALATAATSATAAAAPAQLSLAPDTGFALEYMNVLDRHHTMAELKGQLMLTGKRHAFTLLVQGREALDRLGGLCRKGWVAGLLDERHELLKESVFELKVTPA